MLLSIHFTPILSFYFDKKRYSLRFLVILDRYIVFFGQSYGSFFGMDKFKNSVATFDFCSATVL